MNKPIVKILVCCHKPGEWLSDDVYMPIQCGKAISKYDLDIQGDDTGDNISAKNPYYCELTALYWAWKNLKNVDYIGLCHYRRYFNFNSKSRTVKNVWRNNIYMNKSEVKKEKLRYGEVILPSFNYLPYSVKFDFQNTVLAQDIYILYKIVLKYFPDYAVVLEKYLMGNYRTGFNMFIMDWIHFSEYCNWLFTILEKLEKDIRPIEYTSYKRLYGFIGEILLPVYCIKNKLKIHERQLVYVSEIPPCRKRLIIRPIRNLLNRMAFFIGNIGRSKKIEDNYWDLYLKIDDIKI